MNDACRTSGPREFTCLMCGTLMYGLHCKLTCPNCGCREDCSDLFPVDPGEQPSARGGTGPHPASQDRD